MYCSYEYAFRLCLTAVHNTAQNRSDDLPLVIQTIIIAQMLSNAEAEVLQQNDNINYNTDHTGRPQHLHCVSISGILTVNLKSESNTTGTAKKIPGKF